MSEYPYNRWMQSYVHQGRVGVLVEFGLETHLVTQNSEFIELSKDVAMHIAAANPADIDTLQRQPYVKDTSVTVGTLVENVGARLGERICITRFVRWDQEPLRPTADPTPPREPAVVMRMSGSRG